MTQSDSNLPRRMKRRQFLANLLFTGGALSLASLQGALADPPPDGWTVPPDLHSPNPTPSPQPSKTPQPPRPPLPGRPQMPHPPQPRGKVAVPQVDGGVCAPPPGDVVAPSEPKK